mgnify:CR=1 FL=1
MNKNYNFIDIIKFICALLIIMSHYASEWGNFNSSIDMIFSLYIIAVPFFFVSSSFFFFKKCIIADKHNKEVLIKSYIKRIMLMYGSWSIIYITFNLITWYINGIQTSEVLAYIQQLLVYSSYKTIWFLPATAIGVVMVYYLSKYFNIRQIVAIGVVFYIIGCLGESYDFLLDTCEPIKKIYEAYNSIFITTRNGIFNGFPFAVLGYVIAVGENKQNKFVFDFFMTVLFAVLFVAEAVIIKKLYMATNANTILMLYPFSFFFFRGALSINLKNSKIYVLIRKLSTVMFLSQRIFLSALPALFTDSIFTLMLNYNSWIGLLYVLSTTLIFSLLLIKFSKCPIIKYLV